MRSKLIILLFSLSIVTFSQVSAQEDRMKNVMEDVFEEIDNNNYTLRFFDALTGEPIVGASVMIENVGAFESDEQGRVRFPKQPDGMMKGLFKKDGYIPAVLSIDVAAQTIFRNRFYLSPILDIDQFRVVLSWDEKPGDLDAHFVKDGSYHISYRNTRVLNDGTGQLDIDDVDGFGPETITVSQLSSESTYTFFVNNYSAEVNASAPDLSTSRATVSVFGNNRLLNVFYIPGNLEGKNWNVFRVIQGQVVPAE